SYDVPLTLAGLAAGGMTVGSGGRCYGEATAKVGTSFARLGPKGTAAGLSTTSNGQGALTGPYRRVNSRLVSKTFKIDNLEKSWSSVYGNGRVSKSDAGREKLAKFAENASANLRSLQHRLSRGTFSFGKAKGVPLPKYDAGGRRTGKIRPIVLAPIESRIVQ